VRFYEVIGMGEELIEKGAQVSAAHPEILEAVDVAHRYSASWSFRQRRRPGRVDVAQVSRSRWRGESQASPRPPSSRLHPLRTVDVWGQLASDITLDRKEAGMPGKKSASIKNRKQYEGLRKKGMSKERAAKISNTPGASKKGGKKAASKRKKKS
jgi:hypothetical protein